MPSICRGRAEYDGLLRRGEEPSSTMARLVRGYLTGATPKRRPKREGR